MAAAAPHKFRVWSYVRSALLVLASTAVGDVGCQGILYRSQKKEKEEEPQKPFVEFWDKPRTGVMMVNSFFVMSPIMYTIQFWLEKWFPGNAIKQIAKKMAVGYLITPITVSLTFASVTLLKGKSVNDVQEKISHDLVPTIIAGGFYWPIVHIFNFRFMPFDYRPFVSSFAGAIWNIYMSNQTNKSVSAEKESANMSST